MYKAAFVFYPQAFIGFNKTQRLERHLFSVGFIGSRFSASHAFTSGPAYRQFLPKSETLHRYQFGVIRVHIHAIGQWITNGMLLDRTNLIIVEGDAFISNEEHCKNFCDFLETITGDNYKVGFVENVGCFGIRGPQADYVISENAITTFIENYY